MGYEFIITPTLGDLPEKLIEEIKCSLLLEFAGLYEGEPCRSHLATLLAAETAKTFPQVGERAHGSLATVVVFHFFELMAQR